MQQVPKIDLSTSSLLIDMAFRLPIFPPLSISLVSVAAHFVTMFLAIHPIPRARTSWRKPL
jgi:hypothetical protein